MRVLGFYGNETRATLSIIISSGRQYSLLLHPLAPAKLRPLLRNSGRQFFLLASAHSRSVCQTGVTIPLVEMFSTRRSDGNSGQAKKACDQI